MSATNVGIIGTGGVGAALGGRLLQKGRSVCYGTRDVNSPKVAKLLESQPGATAKGLKETTSWSDIVILAVPGFRDAAAAKTLVDSLGPDITNKVIVDATNPLTAFPGLEVLWDGTSGGELLQSALPNTPVYKAFNTIGDNVLGQPEVVGSPVTMMFAGPDGRERDVVSSLIADIGFQPFYVGPIRYARNLEAVAELWIHLGVPPAGFTSVNIGREFAFNLVKKE